MPVFFFFPLSTPLLLILSLIGIVCVRLCLTLLFLDSDSTLIKDQRSNVSQPSTALTPDFHSTDVHNKEERPIWEAPDTKNMPPPETFHLSKELVQRRAKDNIIIVTFGNYAFMDFILSWVKHLTDLGLSNLLVGKLPNLS